MAEKKSRRKDPGEPLTDEELEALTFEEALAKLEMLVTQMQADSVGLEAAFGLWEEGRRLHAHCQARLDEIEKKLGENQAG